MQLRRKPAQDPVAALMAPAAPSARPHRVEAAVVVGSVAALWLVKSDLVVLRPLVWLAVYVHEAMHALAGMMLGLSVQTITINTRGGGLTFMEADRSSLQTIVVASAGYVGAALVGAGSLELCRRLRSGRVACGAVAALVALVGLLWVPWRFDPTFSGAAVTGSTSGDGRFTTLFYVVTTALFVLLAAQPSARLRRVALLMTASALCLISVEGLKQVLDVSAIGGHSDAKLAETASPLSSWMWSVLWLLFGVSALVASVWSLVGRADREAPAGQATRP